MKLLKRKYILKHKNNYSELVNKFGIFFLIKENKITYVGRTADFLGFGVFTIARKNTVKCDSFYVHHLPHRTNLNDVQARYIVKFKPNFHQCLPKNNIYLSWNVLKKHFKGVSWWTIKRGIREGKIIPYFEGKHFKEENIEKYLNTFH